KYLIKPRKLHLFTPSPLSKLHLLFRNSISVIVVVIIVPLVSIQPLLSNYALTRTLKPIPFRQSNKTKSGNAKATRANMNMPHTSGTISFARRTEMKKVIQSMSMVKVKMAHLLHWKEIFCMRCLDQKKGRVRGMGFGVSPKMFTKFRCHSRE
ncbi:hypothetical protein LINPERPRIM_LOCUS33172, partial [Linum perenne]